MATEVTVIIRYGRASDVPALFEFEGLIDTLDVDAAVIAYEEEEV